MVSRERRERRTLERVRGRRCKIIAHSITNMNKNQLRRAITTAKAALVGLACVSIAVAENKPDELKQRILTQAQSAGPDDYAFTRTVRSESTSNGKTEQHVTIEKFDPTKSGDARWTLISVDGAPP